MNLAFAATNFEEEEQEYNDDRNLIRFEFFEMLVRIARTKFFDTGQTETLAAGLEKIIQKHILPM